MYYDIRVYDMKYDDFKEMCNKSSSEKFNFLCIDMTKNKNEGKYRILNENENTYIEHILETEALKIFQMLFPTRNTEFLEQINDLVSLQNKYKNFEYSKNLVNRIIIVIGKNCMNHLLM